MEYTTDLRIFLNWLIATCAYQERKEFMKLPRDERKMYLMERRNWQIVSKL